MQTSVPSARVCLANASPPVFRPEKAIEIRDLVGMTDKPIDFFVHKIHENLAASLIDYPLHETERGAGSLPGPGTTPASSARRVLPGKRDARARAFKGLARRYAIEEKKKGRRAAMGAAFGAFHIERRRRTMSLQTVALSSLQPGRGNPRKAIDRNSIEGLAASIKNDGLLQNLVVSPVKGKGEYYRNRQR